MRLISKIVFLLCLVLSFFVLKNERPISAQAASCATWETTQQACASGCNQVDVQENPTGPGLKNLVLVQIECNPGNPSCTSNLNRAFNHQQCCDQDGDGYNRAACGGSDCDDTPGSGAGVNPGATEVCADGIDNDCSGGDAFCTESDSSTCDDNIDNDEDGLIDCEDPGCSHHGCVSGCSPSQFAYCQMLGGQGCVDGMCFTPVLIDINGDGIKLSNAPNGVVFDVLPGHPAKLAWTLPGSDDAWLVLDRNGNGTVDSAEELFGNATPQAPPPPGEFKHGFLALAEYDTSAKGGNADGLMTASDAIFSSLRLWQDKNHNGISEPSELRSLSESGVATIECKYKESKRTDEFGNSFRYRAKVKDKHGAQVGRWAWDVFLRMLPQ